MKHSELEGLLSAYADGELARTQREFVERHVVGCATCRATLADYDRDRYQLAALRSIPVPSDLKRATMSRIEATQGGLNRLFPGRVPPTLVRPALVIASTLVAVIAIGILQLSGAGPIEKAEAATAALQSYRAVESITVTKYGETFDSEIDVAVSAPDRFRVSTRNNAGAVEVIGIGDERYTRGAGKEFADVYSVPARIGSILDKVTGPSKADVTGLAINKNSALEILASLVNLEQLPDETIDGYDALRYRGEIDWAQIRWETKETKRSTVELWIDSTDYSLRQAKVEIQVLKEGPDRSTVEWFTMTSWLNYFAFNEPIEIEPPLTSSGDIEPGWSLVDASSPTPKKGGLADVRTR